MGRSRRPLLLSDEQVAFLKKISNSRTAPHREVERAKILLAVMDGKTNDDICNNFGISIPSVNNTINKCRSFGPEIALKDLDRAGRPNVITIEAKTWVINLACQLPQDVYDGPQAQLWSMGSLAKYVQSHCESAGHPSLLKVSKSKIWTILNDNNIKPHRIKYYLQKKDPEFEDKAQDVLLVYKRVEWILQFLRDDIDKGVEPQSCVGETIISYDEKPGIQAIINTAPDLPPTEKYGTVARDYEYKRAGTVSLLAGIDLLTGKAIGLVKESHTSDDFIEFLDKIDQNYDDQLLVRIILDNHSAHKSKKVLEYLKNKPGRFSFTFTPKHASWLNLIESFFAKMARQCLNNLRVKSKEDLIAIINRWIESVNEEPVIFRWKWKLEDIMNAFK